MAEGIGFIPSYLRITVLGEHVKRSSKYPFYDITTSGTTYFHAYT